MNLPDNWTMADCYKAKRCAAEMADPFTEAMSKFPTVGGSKCVVAGYVVAMMYGVCSGFKGEEDPLGDVAIDTLFNEALQLTDIIFNSISERVAEGEL